MLTAEERINKVKIAATKHAESIYPDYTGSDEWWAVYNAFIAGWSQCIIYAIGESNGTI